MNNSPQIVKVTLRYKAASPEVESVLLSNGELWKLNGECNRCGDCCNNINAHDLPLIKKPNGEKGCRFHLFEMNDNRGFSTCLVNWFKPDDCSIYPRDPYEELYKNCSYTWERVE